MQSVKERCNQEKVSTDLKVELLLADWYYDAGYAESHKNHERLGFSYFKRFIEEKFPEFRTPHVVIKLIEATNLKNRADSLQEQIIKNTDLH